MVTKFELEKRLYGKSKKKKPITLSITEDTNDALDEVANHYNRTKHDILTSIIDQFLQGEVDKGVLKLPSGK